jgi:uncharacterized membrane protein
VVTMFGSITTDTITIDAPPAVVWAVYSDIEHWPEWTASVTSARLEPIGPLALRSRASIKQPRFPQVTWTVTDIEPERFWQWVNHSAGALTTAGHRLTPLDGGRTRVDLSIDQRGVIGRPIGWLVKRITRRYLRMEAEGLRNRSESKTDPAD